MYYLVMMVRQEIAGQEYVQSTTRFSDLQDAKTEWHTACAAFQKKDTTLECTGVILNSIGQVMPGLNDHYTKLIPVPEKAAEQS